MAGAEFYICLYRWQFDSLRRGDTRHCGTLSLWESAPDRQDGSKVVRVKLTVPDDLWPVDAEGTIEVTDDGR